MKKRTIYLPDWLDREIEARAKREHRSFSSQVLWGLERVFDNTPNLYFNPSRLLSYVPPAMTWANPDINRGDLEFDE